MGFRMLQRRQIVLVLAVSASLFASQFVVRQTASSVAPNAHQNDSSINAGLTAMRRLEARARTTVARAERVVLAQLEISEGAYFSEVMAAGDSQVVACGLITAKKRDGSYAPSRRFAADSATAFIDGLETKPLAPQSDVQRARMKRMFATCDTTVTFFH